MADNRPIPVWLFDGYTVLTGKTVYVAIKRLVSGGAVDNKYWSGSEWQSGYAPVQLSEQTGGNDYEDGLYLRWHDIEGESLPLHIRWSCTYTGVTPALCFYGNIVKASSTGSAVAWDELLSAHEAAGSFGELIKKLQARELNKSTHNRLTGEVKDYDTAGSGVVNTFGTSEQGSVETRTPA